jgi:hypothetical protein
MYLAIRNLLPKELKETKLHSQIAARLRTRAAAEPGAARKSPSLKQSAGRGAKACREVPANLLTVVGAAKRLSELRRALGGRRRREGRSPDAGAGGARAEGGRRREEL